MAGLGFGVEGFGLVGMCLGFSLSFVVFFGLWAWGLGFRSGPTGVRLSEWRASGFRVQGHVNLHMALASNPTAMESSMEKYTRMLGFPSLEALKAEYSTEASANWERVARSVAQSVASGRQRPGVGPTAWTRNAAAIAPALPQPCFLGEWNQESQQFGLQLLREFENNLGRAP